MFVAPLGVRSQAGKRRIVREGYGPDGDWAQALPRGCTVYGTRLLRMLRWRDIHVTVEFVESRGSV